MKFRGGYNVPVAGMPSRQVEVLGEPDVLYLPRWSARFRFSDLSVEEGQRVSPGQVLAKDPGNHSVPLLAPRAGTVRLDTADHVVLEGVVPEEQEPYEPREGLPHVPKDAGSGGMKRHKLMVLGAWQYFYDAHTKMLPDPFGTPRAVIISTLRLEPFLVRGDVQMEESLTTFTRGIEHLQSLLEYQPIYLVLPDIQSELARRVRESVRGYAWVKLFEIPLRYSLDDFAVLARALGYGQEAESPVWGLYAEGVLAVDRALMHSAPCSSRTIALGGPEVGAPVHLEAMPGYPIDRILEGRLTGESVRVINGGALTGRKLESGQLGLDSECAGLTVLSEEIEREFLGFLRPGSDRRSYSRCFLSSLFDRASGRLKAAVRGEKRACIACIQCEQVCPAGIRPHVIHKFLYQDLLENAEQARLDLCVGCGLCSYVCPSKIELYQQFMTAQETVWEEQRAVETTE